MIEFRNVTKVYGEGAAAVHALRDLTFTLPAGEFWAIMGPSGSGKSTVLHLAAGLAAPTSGNVLVDGTDVAALDNQGAAELRRRTVGYVLQTFNLIPFLTAEENIAMPLVLDGIPRAEIDARVAEMLSLVEMGDRAHHKPTTLSGGEQQRVAIARALVIRPSVLLADEPTGNLDRASGRAVMNLISDINEKSRLSVLMVTHDPVFASYADRILRIVDGRLDQDIDVREDIRDER